MTALVGRGVGEAVLGGGAVRIGVGESTGGEVDVGTGEWVG